MLFFIAFPPTWPGMARLLIDPDHRGECSRGQQLLISPKQTHQEASQEEEQWTCPLCPLGHWLMKGWLLNYNFYFIWYLISAKRAIYLHALKTWNPKVSGGHWHLTTFYKYYSIFMLILIILFNCLDLILYEGTDNGNNY